MSRRKPLTAQLSEFVSKQPSPGGEVEMTLLDRLLQAAKRHSGMQLSPQSVRELNGTIQTLQEDIVQLHRDVNRLRQKLKVAHQLAPWVPILRHHFRDSVALKNLDDSISRGVEAGFYEREWWNRVRKKPSWEEVPYSDE